VSDGLNLFIGDGVVIVCGGGARPTDLHLASTIHCVDDEIIEWLERRERRGRHRQLLAVAMRPSPSLCHRGSRDGPD
jgi:hypothetical protein